MPPLHALDDDNPQRVFDNINRHFQLTPEALTDLTTAFVEEIGLGLAKYNHPMAMVYVLSLVSLPILTAR